MTSAPELPRASDSRLHALDGLRGVAAIAVLLYHAVAYVEMPAAVRSAIDLSPLGPLVNGPGAVHVFFVLSGYVLALALQADTRPGRLPRYYLRRIFRIHPPYVAAVLLAWATSQLLVPPGPPAPDLPWIRVPAAALPVALAFPSMAFGLLPVGWSLFVEMAMSAVFPLLLLLGRGIHPLAPLALSLCFLGDLDRRWFFLRFTFDFALGLALRLEAERTARALRRLPRAVPAVAFAAGLVLLQLPFAAGFAAAGHGGLEMGHSGPIVVQFAIASGLLLVGALHAPRLGAALSSGLGRFFGRISYSLYLVHHTVLLAFVVRADGFSFAWPAGVAVAIATFAITLALAVLGWRFVERPSIEMARALIRGGERLAARAAAR